MKPVVFISHITEEAEIAIALKELIEPNFLGLLDIFVSSDGESIGMGQKWLNTVSEALKNCAVQLVICSPKSVTKPWVNFEAGAAWVRDVPVVPLCHSGMTPSLLPVPLSLLQSAKLTDIAGLNLVIPVLAQALGATTPRIDFTEFVRLVSVFEERYTFWDECNAAFSEIARAHPKIIPLLRTHVCLDLDLPGNCINAIERFVPFLRSRQLLDFRRAGRTSNIHWGSGGGNFDGCQMRKLAKLDVTMSSPNFKLEPGNPNTLRDWYHLDMLVKPCQA